MKCLRSSSDRSCPMGSNLRHMRNTAVASAIQQRSTHHARITVRRLRSDLQHDEADMDKKISCPVLVLWGANGLVRKKYDVLSVWKDRATRVSGKALPGGHWPAEELPHQILSEVRSFFAA